MSDPVRDIARLARGATIRLAERVPASVPRSRLTVGGLVLAYAALYGVAFAGAPWWFLALTVVVLAGELAVGWVDPPVGRTLRRVGSGGSTRALLRGVAALVLVARVDLPGSWLVLTAAGIAGLGVLALAGTAIADLVHRRRTMPLVPRGLNLGALDVPAAPPIAFGRRAGECLPLADLGLLVGVALAAGLDSLAFAVAGLALGLAYLLVAFAVLLRSVLVLRGLPSVVFTAAVQHAVADAGARVVVHFGGEPRELYQLEAWVPTLERLGIPTVVVVRDRQVVRELGPTRLPVIAVERGSDLMALPLPNVRLALYVSHAPANVDLLRRHGIRHVFLGHGDSDKSFTTNPNVKAYDEQWVAGPAAAERLRQADIGLGDDRIVAIGRPQLDDLVAMQGSGPGYVVTILYAPTWEGYGDAPHETSLPSFGIDLVRWLLAEPDIRVLYRPHPLTGSQDATARRAHQEILRLLGPHAGSPRAPRHDTDQSRTRDDLDAATAPATISRTERLAALEIWSRKQLAAGRSDHQHLHVPGPQFSLFTCFEAADALVCDVSSLISDFVVTGKPYAVTDPVGRPEPEFVAGHPSARAGYVVQPDGAGLDALLTAARGDGDSKLSSRRALSAELVGPPNPPALERMRAQIRRVLQEGIPASPEAGPAGASARPTLA